VINSGTHNQFAALSVPQKGQNLRPAQALNLYIPKISSTGSIVSYLRVSRVMRGFGAKRSGLDQ
jgi:hypothetical protein